MSDPLQAALLFSHFPELRGIEVSEMLIPGRRDPVPARLYRGRNRAQNASIVWAHGGGFIAGDLDMPESHWVGLTLADRGYPTLAVDYQKCIDGVHFPLPSDDVLDAWLWADEHGREMFGSRENIHLGGASAGGCLAAGVAKRLRDSSGPMPKSMVLVYALVHAELPPPSWELLLAINKLTDNYLTPDICRRLSLNYAGSEETLNDPYAFPANGSLGNLPPTFLLNSERDPLRASGEAFGSALADADVEVKVECEPLSEHGYLNEPITATAQQSIDRIVAWLQTHD